MELSESPALRWSQRQRFAFIERRLYWEGVLNRQDLMTRFGISAPQASMDVQRYDELAPCNVEFDRSRKVYVALPGFKPKYFEPSARHYLNQLLLQSDQAVPAFESWLGKEPDFAAIPRVRRKMDAETLRRALRFGDSTRFDPRRSTTTISLPMPFILAKGWLASALMVWPVVQGC